MPQAFYTLAKQSLGKAEINFTGADIRAILIDSADYTVNLATDQFLSDIPALARVAVSTALTGVTWDTSAILDADDVVFSAVTGDISEAIVLYMHTGVETTSRLLTYDDTATGLPVTPDGTDITIQWSAGANKIFKL